MPLFVIHRDLDPRMTPDERDMMAIRSIGPIEPVGVQHPTWHRSFVAAADDRFETWCVYEGKSREAIEHWNFTCRVPFADVTEVDQWWNAPGERAAAVQLLRGTAPAGIDERLEELKARPERGAVRWVQTYRGKRDDSLYTIVLAPDIDAAKAFAVETGLPADLSDTVDEVIPRDYAQYYEVAGRRPYEGDD
jgi:hypothetical protein